MRAVAVVVVALASTSACAESGRADAARPPADSGSGAGSGGRYLALGDSFTIGTGSEPSRAFPSRLVARWRTTGCALVLENIAVNGYTTDDLLARELPEIASFHPTFVTVAIGANDIVQRHTLESYRVNARRILDAVKASGARVVVIPQPDWSRSPAAASIGTASALAESITRFNAVLAEEARAKGTEWVDLVPLMQQQAARGDLASDGLHPSAAAYDAWAGELARLVTPPCR